jgi:EpsI family protein
MAARLMVVALCLVGGYVVLTRASRVESPAPHESLARFPLDIAAWHGRRAPDFEQSILAELGVDEYVNDVYEGPSRVPLGLYIGYYASQRQGDTIHSPANCLPGAGWQPISTGRLSVPVPAPGEAEGMARQIQVARWVIEKGDERELVLYWYQSHGRVIASEYWSKIYLVRDALRLNRTDGALVRVITPIAGASDDDVSAAERMLMSFVKSMFPLLHTFLPA